MFYSAKARVCLFVQRPTLASYTDETTFHRLPLRWRTETWLLMQIDYKMERLQIWEEVWERLERRVSGERVAQKSFPGKGCHNIDSQESLLHFQYYNEWRACSLYEYRYLQLTWANFSLCFICAHGSSWNLSLETKVPIIVIHREAFERKNDAIFRGYSLNEIH